jgi:hypothetical protein
MQRFVCYRAYHLSVIILRPGYPQINERSKFLPSENADLCQNFDREDNYFGCRSI